MPYYSIVPPESDPPKPATPKPDRYLSVQDDDDVARAEVEQLVDVVAANGGGELSSELALDLLLNSIVEQARLATGASGAAIALVRDGEMVCRATAGPTAPDLGVKLDTRLGLSGACVSTGQIQVCDDTEADPRVDAVASRQLGARSILIIPLFESVEILGVFEIFSTRPSAFSQRDIHTMQALSRKILKDRDTAAKRLSADGVNWTRDTEKAPWHPRLWFSSVVYRGRMWVLGGWSNNPSRNWGDVWHSRDGKEWTRLRSKVVWKERVMGEFKEGTMNVLVATTVVEVGIDVPNASVMVIEHAERFGLSQLHQLRGRVGRGSGRSRCILLTDGRLSEEGEKRLRVMEATTDGFRIAEADLEIRGPGDFLGTRQAGLPDFRVANILRDARVLEEARREAFLVVEKDPDLSRPEHARLRAELLHRWGGRLELAGIA